MSAVSPGFLAGPGKAFIEQIRNRGTRGARIYEQLQNIGGERKATLHELCRVMGLPGKPDGIAGDQVERFYREGRIREIAEYCESDVVNTYRVWLRSTPHS